MQRSSSQAAEQRAASAALNRPADLANFDRYLLIDDNDDDMTEIHTLLRERLPRGLEVQS